MIKRTSILALLFIFLYIFSNISVANDTNHQDPFSEVGGWDEKHHKDRSRLLVKLVGWSEAYAPGSGEGMVNNVPNVDGDVVCHDVEMVNLRNNELIGISTDCFSDAEPDSGGGAGFIGTTFLNFPDGTIIAQGKFTAQPVLRETTTIDGVPITAITGAGREGNSFIGGWGKFESSSGNVRVSGMINGEGYAFMPGDPLYFDCIFEIQLFDEEENGSDTTNNFLNM
jgi:hypothetical protein